MGEGATGLPVPLGLACPELINMTRLLRLVVDAGATAMEVGDMGPILLSITLLNTSLGMFKRGSLWGCAMVCRFLAG